MADDHRRSFDVGEIYKSTNASHPQSKKPVIEIKRDLPQEIFQHIRDAVKKGVSAFGVSVEDSMVKFTQKKCLFRDFSKICGVTQSDIKTKLKKTFGGNRKNFRAEVLVDDHKPFTIRYDHKQQQQQQH